MMEGDLALPIDIHYSKLTGYLSLSLSLSQPLVECFLSRRLADRSASL